MLPEQDKKKGRNKRAPKGGEKPLSRYKKRRKDGEEKTGAKDWHSADQLA